jgi:phosphoenolpyruvate synthase/pyruvate phosphate dikinase
VEWYRSPSIINLLSNTIADALCIEEHPGLMRRYALHEQLEEFKKSIKDIVINNPTQTQHILTEGLKLNQEAKSMLNTKTTHPLPQSVNFLFRLMTHATLFPDFTYVFLKELPTKNNQLINLAETLRTMSYYPRIIEEIIVPIAKQKLQNNDVAMLTLMEVLRKDTSPIATRKSARMQGKRWAYQRLGASETVELIDNPLAVIQELEKTTDIFTSGVIQGTIAYPGKIQGHVRLIFTNDLSTNFSVGDIIVAPSTNPTLLPFMTKAGAIVTDEGGIACHAAIIARELNIPCIVGTKIATKVFKDGDLVEVDAEKGMVRKLS